MKTLGVPTKQYNVPNGYIAELKFEMLSWNNGWQIAKPAFDNAPYDYVIMGLNKNARWDTVQVKLAYKYKNRYRVDLRRKKSNNIKYAYQKGDFDFLFIYKEDTKDWYCIPFDQLINIKTEISLSPSSKWNRFKYG